MADNILQLGDLLPDRGLRSVDLIRQAMLLLPGSVPLLPMAAEVDYTGEHLPHNLMVGLTQVTQSNRYPNHLTELLEVMPPYAERDGVLMQLGVRGEIHARWLHIIWDLSTTM